MAELDSDLLPVAAPALRSRIARLAQDKRMDRLERVEAHRALTQLAKDFVVSADQVGSGRRSAKAGRRQVPPPVGIYPENLKRCNLLGN